MRESIFAHSLQIGRLGNTRQLLGINHKGETIILAQLPQMSDERALLVDKRALARALQFHLIQDERSPAKIKASAARLTSDAQTLAKILALALGAAILALARGCGIVR